MSLTTELREKTGSLKKFFNIYEDSVGLQKIKKKLLDPNDAHSCFQKSIPSWAYGHIGTTVDYLVRYVANGNKLSWKDTVAYEVVKNAENHKNQPPPICEGEPFEFDYMEDWPHLIKAWFRLGKQCLSGCKATSEKAIFGATTLAIVDNWHRSGTLGSALTDELERWYWYEYLFTKRIRRSNLQKATYLARHFILNMVPGQIEEYYEEISNIMNTFIKKRRSKNSFLYKAKLIQQKGSLSNSSLVGGADYDCVIKNKGKTVLTEIKTTIKPLSTFHLRQLISYLLLYDEKLDGVAITDIGVLYPRTGTIRKVSVRSVIKDVFPELKNINTARNKLVETINKELISTFLRPRNNIV